MNTELFAIRLPEEPQRANAGRYAETLWSYGDRVGALDEIGRVYERDCKEILQKEYDKLLGVLQLFMQSPTGKLLIEGKSVAVNSELIGAVARVLGVQKTSTAQAADLLARRVEEYHLARSNHDRLLSYSTDFDVSPDGLSRSADALQESQAALNTALTTYRKVTARS